MHRLPPHLHSRRHPKRNKSRNSRDPRLGRNNINPPITSYKTLNHHIRLYFILIISPDYILCYTFITVVCASDTKKIYTVSTLFTPVCRRTFDLLDFIATNIGRRRFRRKIENHPEDTFTFPACVCVTRLTHTRRCADRVSTLVCYTYIPAVVGDDRLW